MPGRGGGPPRGGFRGRGRGGGNFGIWQENVQAIHSPQLKQEEDRAVARFIAKKDESPELPLRVFLPSVYSTPSHRFVFKVLAGAR